MDQPRDRLDAGDAGADEDRRDDEQPGRSARRARSAAGTRRRAAPRSAASPKLWIRSASSATLPDRTKISVCTAAATASTASDSGTARTPSRERLIESWTSPCEWPAWPCAAFPWPWPRTVVRVSRRGRARCPAVVVIGLRARRPSSPRSLRETWPATPGLPTRASFRTAPTIASASIPARAHQLLGLAGPGHVADRELDHRRPLGVPRPARSSTASPKPTLGPVVLDGHDRARLARGRGRSVSASIGLIE